MSKSPITQSKSTATAQPEPRQLSFTALTAPSAAPFDPEKAEDRDLKEMFEDLRKRREAAKDQAAQRPRPPTT